MPLPLILQTLQDWHLSLIVLMFVAIDVLILVAYVTHSSVQNMLWAVRQRNLENPLIEIDVRWYQIFPLDLMISNF